MEIVCIIYILNMNKFKKIPLVSSDYGLLIFIKGAKDRNVSFLPVLYVSTVEKFQSLRCDEKSFD